MSVTQAAREGARRAVVKGPEGQAATVAARHRGRAHERGAAEPGPDGRVGYRPQRQLGAGEPIKVTVTYPYKVDLLGFAFKQGTLSASTTMRRE